MSSAGNPIRAAYALARLTPKRVWVDKPLNTNELVVYWVPKPFAANRYPSGYNVYRTVSPTTAFASPQSTKLNSSLITVPLYRDQTVDTETHTHHYYVVTEVFPDGNELALDDPTTLHDTTHLGRKSKNISMPRIFAEYRRRKHLLLRDNGEYVDIMVRRQAGTRCDCFVGEYETAAKADCDQCYGTSWDRGYELLRDVVCRITSIKETLRLQPAGLELKSNPRGWLVEFPLLRNGDVIVRRTGQRYEVNNLDLTVHQGVLTGQDFDLTFIDFNHPIYGFNVPLSDGA